MFIMLQYLFLNIVNITLAQKNKPSRDQEMNPSELSSPRTCITLEKRVKFADEETPQQKGGD